MSFNKEIYNNTEIASGYKAFVLKIAQMLNSTNMSLKQDIDLMFELEKEIANVKFCSFEFFDIEIIAKIFRKILNTKKIQIDETFRRASTYQNITIKELQSRLPNVSF